MKKIYICLLFSAFYFTDLYSEKKPPVGFIENKGQIHDQNLKPNPEVKFLLNTPGMNVQLKANSFSYDTYTVEQKENSSSKRNINKKINLPETENIYRFHRVDVEFLSANSNPEIISENPSETYFNYYTTGTSEKGVTHVRSFSKITYKNLYPNIDLEFISDNGKLKYNFILHFGADINQIKWQYKGSDNSKLNKQNIEIKVQQGLFTETIPESYLSIDSRKLKTTKINFISLGNNIYGFNSANNIILKSGEKLIIDPTPNVLWTSYFGRAGTDWLVSSCLDVSNNMFATGNTSSSTGIATAGASQTIYGGGAYDAVILKCNPSGSTLKWATYYGGSGADYGCAIVIDKSFNLLVSGWTGSNASIMTTAGVHQPTYGGGPYDVFLAKFDTNGVRQWSTYYGGTGDDEYGGLALDNLDNIYLAGASSSTNAIATLGSHQIINGGGASDAFLIKFNNNGVRQWGTYYGDSGDDNGIWCATDSSNNIYMSGSTSSSLSISTVGSHQTSFGGGRDALIVKFDKNGVRQWGTYYGGGGINDEGTFIYYDVIGASLYLTGSTDSNDSIATVGSHQSINSGGMYDAFLAKFSTSGVRQWATYYGGTDFDYGLCVTTDSANVYFGGASRSFSSIATPNAFQTTLMPGFYGDAILVKFNKNGVRQWGTYWGGAIGEQIYSATVRPSGDIYLVGATSSYSMSTPGSFQAGGGGNWEGFCAKFGQNILTQVLEEKIEQNYLNIFPNPNNGSFTIESKDDVVLTIVNELGQIIKKIKLDNTNNHKFILSNLESGVYSIADEFGKSHNKVVVVK